MNENETEFAEAHSPEAWKTLSPSLTINKSWHEFVDYVTVGPGQRALPTLTCALQGDIAYAFLAGFNSAKAEDEAESTATDNSAVEFGGLVGLVEQLDKLAEAVEKLRKI